MSYCSVVSEPAAAAGQLDLRDRDEHLGARLEIRRLEQRLFLAHAERAHHAQRVDERLVGRLLDALQSTCTSRRVDEVAQRLDDAGAVDLVLAGARREIGGEGLEVDAAAGGYGVDRRQLLLDAEARDADRA